MAVTIAVFAGLVVGAYLAREHYAEPLVAVSGVAVPGDALVTGHGVIGPAGERMSWDEAVDVCAGADPVGCLRERGFGEQFTLYQPADRYWRFQWAEAGLLLVVALVLAGVTARRVVSRSR